jgi:hypothetical protein
MAMLCLKSCAPFVRDQTPEGTPMLAEQFTAAADGARNTAAVDELARLTWRAHAEGQLADADAEAIGVALQARRRAFGQGRDLPPSRPALGPPMAARRAPRSPDREVSLERRRRQAMSGIVPAKIASAFTMGEVAVLSVIGRQVQRTGVCVLPIDAIGAMAGVSRSLVKAALRQARLVGLVLVKERRVPGRKSMTNVVTIVSTDWLSWLRIGGPRIGVRFSTTTDNPAFNPESSRPSHKSQEAFRYGKTQNACRSGRDFGQSKSQPFSRHRR